MKPGIIWGCIGLALLASLLLHANKIRDCKEDPQLVFDGLAGIKTHLHPGQTIYVHNVGGRSENRLYARLALVPMQVVIRGTGDGLDTALLISGTDHPDSLAGFPRIFWEHRDGPMMYQLLARK